MIDHTQLVCDPLAAEWDFWGHWADGRWEPETHAIINRFMSDGGTFIDVGAWVGPTTLWALEAGADRVVAFEPDPTAFEMLLDNVQDAPGVRCVQRAVSDRNGTTMINTAGDSMSRNDNLTEPHVPVPCCTLGSFLIADGPDALREIKLIKMDVEGAERVILVQAERFLRELGAPLLLSLHHWAPWDRDLLSGWDRVFIASDEWLCTPP